VNHQGTVPGAKSDVYTIALLRAAVRRCGHFCITDTSRDTSLAAAAALRPASVSCFGARSHALCILSLHRTVFSRSVAKTASNVNLHPTDALDRFSQCDIKEGSHRTKYSSQTGAQYISVKFVNCELPFSRVVSNYIARLVGYFVELLSSSSSSSSSGVCLLLSLTADKSTTVGFNKT